MNITFIIIASIVGVILFYALISLNIIKADEAAVITWLGKPIKVVGSGLVFCPKFVSKLLRYETTPLIFNIRVPSVTTKNGKVLGYKENGGEIERADLNIDITLVTYFSTDLTKKNNDLLTTARKAPGNDAASLQDALCPYVIDIVRSVFSEMPWPLLNQNRKDVLNYLLSRIIPNHHYDNLIIEQKQEQNNIFSYYSFYRLGNGGVEIREKLVGESKKQMKRNPFVQFKLDTSQTTISIKNIDFCDPNLVKSLAAAETARLNSEAQRIEDDRIIEKSKKQGFVDAEIELKKGFNKAKIDKEQGEVSNELLDKKNKIEARDIKVKGLASANARKAMIAEIKNNPDLEYLRTLEEMAKGTSNTILYQIPGAFESKISNILGGNKLATLLPLLKDPEVMEALKEAIGKLK